MRGIFILILVIILSFSCSRPVSPKPIDKAGEVLTFSVPKAGVFYLEDMDCNGVKDFVFYIESVYENNKVMVILNPVGPQTYEPNYKGGIDVR